MASILRQLNVDDMFNIIVFSSEVARWQSELVAATDDNINTALHWLSSFPVDGGKMLAPVLKVTFKVMSQI